MIRRSLLYLVPAVTLILIVGARAQARDPFAPPAAPVAPKTPPPEVLPPGLAGVNLDQIHIRGVALGGPSGPVALAAGPHDSVYFLRPGARLHDATVLRMDGNGVWFQPLNALQAAPVYRPVSGS